MNEVSIMFSRLDAKLKVIDLKIWYAKLLRKRSDPDERMRGTDLLNEALDICKDISYELKSLPEYDPKVYGDYTKGVGKRLIKIHDLLDKSWVGGVN